MRKVSVYVMWRRHIGKCGGCDFMEGLSGAVAQFGVGVRQHVSKGRDGAGGLRSKSRDGFGRRNSDYSVRALQAADQSWNGEVRSGSEPAYHVDCHERKGFVVRVTYACNYCRNGEFGGVAHVRHASHGGNGLPLARVAWILNNGEKSREGVCSKASQIFCGPSRRRSCVGSVHQPGQVLEGWCGPCPQNVKGLVGSDGELLRSLLGDAGGKPVSPFVRKSLERSGELISPLGWFVLDPLEKERERGGPDMSDSVGCALRVAPRRRAPAKDLHPKAQGVSSIGRLGVLSVREKSDYRDRTHTEQHGDYKLAALRHHKRRMEVLRG